MAEVSARSLLQTWRGVFDDGDGEVRGGTQFGGFAARAGKRPVHEDEKVQHHRSKIRRGLPPQIALSVDVYIDSETSLS